MRALASPAAFARLILDAWWISLYEQGRDEDQSRIYQAVSRFDCREDQPHNDCSLMDACIACRPENMS
jgi:hypothetical protein